MENIAQPNPLPPFEQDKLLGHVRGVVEAHEPARSGEGTIVVTKLAKSGRTARAYFAQSGTPLPAVGETVRLSAWEQQGGNVSYRRETTTAKDIADELE